MDSKGSDSDSKEKNCVQRLWANQQGSDGEKTLNSYSCRCVRRKRGEEFIRAAGRKVYYATQGNGLKRRSDDV